MRKVTSSDDVFRFIPACIFLDGVFLVELALPVPASVLDGVDVTDVLSSFAEGVPSVGAGVTPFKLFE